PSFSTRPHSGEFPMRTAILSALLLIFLPIMNAEAAEPGFKAGAAARVITPGEPIWMAGYAVRNKPAEGKEHELYVKAIALEDAGGGRVVLLTSDLIGLPRSLSEAVAEEVRKKTELPRERLMLTCSHTHCGPVVAGSLTDMYDMPAEQREKLAPYADQLR